MKKFLALCVAALLPYFVSAAPGDIKIPYKADNNISWIDAIFAKSNNSILGLNATGIPSVVTVGSGVSLSGGVLSATGLGGTVTSVGVTTANGVSASPSTITGAGSFTFSLGAITPSSVAATGTVTGSNLSGTNTGDQTNITGNAGTATILQSARTINGVSFNGSANITVTAAASTLTGATLAAGIVNSSLVNAAGGTFGSNAFNSTAYEPALGNPSVSGYILSSTTGGVRSWIANSGGGGGGTVTSVSVTTANGVSGSVANATTTPAITLTLGAITPTTVNGNTLTTGTGTLTLGAGKTFASPNTLTLTATDGSTLAIGTGGTLGTAAYTAATAYVPAYSGLTTNGVLQATSATTVASTLTPSGLTSLGAGTLAATTTVTAGTQLISSVATGTAPLAVTSTTNVANLNASSLSGATFAAPGAIGGTTPSTGKFTTIETTGTAAIGTPPLSHVGLEITVGLSGASSQIGLGPVANGDHAANFLYGVLVQRALGYDSQAIGNTSYGVNIENVSLLNSSTLTNNVGLFIQSQTSGSNNWSIFTGTGLAHFGGNADVTGTFTATSTVQGTQLISTVATGTAPLTVASTTLVANLHAATADAAPASGLTGTVAIGSGGTGQTTASAAFNALSPMTTAGDIIYGGASGAGTRLAAGTSVQVLHGGTTPSWAAVSLTADVSGILPTANGGTGIAYFTAAGPTTARVYTFPDAAATIARTDAANTFTGASTGTSWNLTTPVITSGLTASGSGANTFAGSTGTFATSTGANTISGAATFNSTLALGGTALTFGALPSGATTTGALSTVSAQTYTVTGTNTATAFQAAYNGAPTFTDASAGTVTDLFSEVWSGPAAVAGSLVGTRKHTLGIVDSTSAASAITGGFIVATTLGTAATSVGIGGGNVNAGGTITGATVATGSGGLDMTASAQVLTLNADGLILWSARTRVASPSAGVLNTYATGTTQLTRLNLGTAVNSSPALGVDAVNSLRVQSAAGTETYNDPATANSGTVANAYVFGIAAPTKTSTGTSVTHTVDSTVYIGGAPAQSGNLTIGTAYALNVAAGTTLLQALRMGVAAPLSIVSGTNQRAGNATLVGGTVTVNNTTVTANSILMLTRKTSGGTIGTAITYTTSAATSFTINSDNILDTSVFSYVIIEVP